MASRKCIAMCALLLSWAAAKRADAQTSQQVKPYVLLILDVSGSMDDATGAGPPSCGGADTKFNHAKCAIQNLVNTHGDIIFGLSEFRAVHGDNTTCTSGGLDCDNFITCGDCLNGEGESPDRFELLVPLVEENADDVLSWVDFSQDACSLDPADNPEVTNSSDTPIAGSLAGAKRYWQGNDPWYAGDLQPIYGVTPGDPIRNDPLKDVFVDGQQCRPYIVITLTDGDETCADFSTTTANASSLLTTDVDGKTYTIETKPIGFGQTPCDTQIEGLAHAGGATDDGNSSTCEGYYAQDEADLNNAFNTIIQDSLKVEVCNGIDDDCDGNIDEGYQLYCDADNGHMTADLCADPGDDCDGMDDNCFMGTMDEPVNDCGFCGPLPTEVCNGLDDDCDNNTDEGNVCNGCTPQGAEICNNMDEDCDGNIDEGLTRDCGTDVGECEKGTEKCQNGSWVDCDAIGPQPEMCDGLDNDCDGSVDGFARQCTEIQGNDPPYDGPCQPGTQVCTDGSFEACLGEVGPAPAEACDLVDNDCDGSVDEDTGGADCSNSCGQGTTVCQSGVIVCQGENSSSDEVCNAYDDDCDGTVDEDVADMGDCDEGGTLCLPGTLKCIGGTFQCVGGVEPGIEICDCKDNNCNGEVDEEPPALCPAGSACVQCQCASPCGEGEFPCPVGQYCDQGYCLADPCYGVSCPPQDGEAYECVDGDCVRSCDLKSCTSPLVCRPSDGSCVPDDCTGFPDRCAMNELCVGGECVSNPCADVDCPAGNEYCFEGECVTSCAGIRCQGGDVCVLGECQPDPCMGACGDGEVCDADSGDCVGDPCLGVSCASGQACDPQTGECTRDPCLGVSCPSGQICRGGSCFSTEPGADAGPDDSEYVTPGGGGGCDAGGGSGPGGALLLLLALAFVRRRGDR